MIGILCGKLLDIFNPRPGKDTGLILGKDESKHRETRFKDKKKKIFF